MALNNITIYQLAPNMRVALTLVLVACFVVMMMISIGNQLSGKTWMNDEVVDMDQVLYPSVSVCQNYPYEDGGKLSTVLKNISISTEGKIKIARENVRNADQLFYFVNHPGMRIKPFPCTVHGGTDKGAPCSFPFVNAFAGNISSTCVPDPIEGESWCLTKTDENRTYLGFWGYCSPLCKGIVLIKVLHYNLKIIRKLMLLFIGENPEPSSLYNLAKVPDEKMWSSNFFSFSPWYPGFCVTYNPPMKSLTSHEDTLVMFLGNKKDSPKYLEGYDIYLHEKGQFWPKEGMEKIGQSDVFHLKHDHELKADFDFQEISYFDKPEKRCDEKPDYSFTMCVMNYAAVKSKCKIDIKEEQTMCGNDDFIEFQNLLKLFLGMTMNKIIATTGCNPKCNILKYSFHKVSDKVSSKTKNIYNSKLRFVYLTPLNPLFVRPSGKMTFGPEGRF